MKKSILMILLMFPVVLPSLQAQKTEFGIEASVNFPVIPAVETSHASTSSSAQNTGYYIISTTGSGPLRETYQGFVGGKIDVTLVRHFKNKVFLKTGIGLNFIRIKRDVLHTSQINLSGVVLWQTINNPLTKSSNFGRASIIYTDIPFLAGYRILRQRLAVSLGLNTSFLTYSEQNKVTFNSSSGYLYQVPTEDKSSDGLTNLVFSFSAEISYQVLHRFTLFGRYSKQLNALYDKDYQYAGRARYHLLEMGIGYLFR